MIERNIVRIETLDRMGTGLIYPCCRENSTGYIIFTNRHVLESIPDMENIQDHIQIAIYDDFGKEISDTKMKNWDCYWNKNNSKYQDDIAVIYMELGEDVVFHPEMAVELDQLDNRTTVYMEGYPGVMSNDDINRRIQLEGVSKSLFPDNKEIGAYQITDDYHWYNNYSDYKVLSGVSGSPVYYQKGGRNYILGINQSVSNIDQGENPFKLVYYIKFKHILDYLRQEDCILFSRVSECEFQILWSKNNKLGISNEIKLLLIGGSGSGKSSFVRSFAYHQSKIKGVGDGQTTRTDVNYSFSRVRKDPNAKVIFLTKNEFVNHMTAHIGTRPIRLTFAQALGISVKVVEDEEKFLLLLFGLYEQFARLEDQGKGAKDCKNVLEYIRELLFYGETVRNKTVKYENILDHLLGMIPYYFMPCVLDKSWIYEHPADRDLKDGEVLEFFGISNIQDNVNTQIWIKFAQKIYDILKKNKKKHFDTLQKDLAISFYDMNKGRFSTLIGFKADQIQQMIHRDSHKEFEYRLKNREFQRELFDSLVYAKGFFNAKEFEFLLGKDWIESIYEKDRIVEFRKMNDEDDEEEMPDEEEYTKKPRKPKEKDIVIASGMKIIWDSIYEKIMGAIRDKYAGYYDNTEKAGLLFDLNNMDEKGVMTLQKCLKVAKDGSFTGIVQNVTIQDKISDMYASILKKLEIDILTIVDTCGLDHVTVWNKKELKRQVERLYTDYVKRWEMNKEKRTECMKETGILYIKKLDSGKPDELQSILPIVRQIIPSTPMYCIFSGIDIFYRTEQEISNIFWKRNAVNCPKAVRYILENDMGMQDIVDANAYKVLKNNLIPFCGDEKLVHTKFAYYKNNVGAVRKMLTSIAMKESSSLEIIDQSFIQEVIDGRHDKEIEDILKVMFETASLHSRSIWWNTQKAGIKSFFKDGVMGYRRTYNHMLYYLFHEGYVTSIREKGNDLFKDIDGAVTEVKYKTAVIASLYNMENLFLGINDNLIETNLNDNEKNEFRRIIEEMYKQSRYDPFSENYEECLTEDYIKEHRIEIFDEVFEFTKYITEGERGIEICRKLVSFFKQQFLKQMEIDNNRKATYLVKMNDAFIEELDKMRREFCEKYGDADSEGNEMFKTFMRYYFSSSENK